MELNEYQREAMKTAVYPPEVGLVYVALKLAGEAGEFNEKVGKAFRDRTLTIAGNWVTPPTPELHSSLVGELGDQLWYVAAACGELGITMQDLAQQNLDKLRSRAKRGVILGSGDDR